MTHYRSKRKLIVFTDKGTVESKAYAGAYRLSTDDPNVMRRIEAMQEYKFGQIYKYTDEQVAAAKANEPSDDDSPKKVKNAKQALEWLVRNKGEKRGVFSSAEIRAMAEKHGVEFPKWK